MSKMTAVFALVVLVLTVIIAHRAGTEGSANLKPVIGYGATTAGSGQAKTRNSSNAVTADAPSRSTNTTGSTTKAGSATTESVTAKVNETKTLLDTKISKSSSSRLGPLPAIEFTAKGSAVLAGVIVFGMMGAVLQ